MKRKGSLGWEAVQYQVIFKQLSWTIGFNYFSVIDYEYQQTKMFHLKICTISSCIQWCNFHGTRVGMRLKFQKIVSPWNKNK